MLCLKLIVVHRFGLNYRAYGPLTPRILRRRRGHRDDGKAVTHIVAKTMTAEMVRKTSIMFYVSQKD